MGASMGMGVEYPVGTTRAMVTQAMRALMEAEAFHRWATVQGKAAMDIAVAHYPAEERRVPALRRQNQCQPTSDGPGLNGAPGRTWSRSQSPSSDMTLALGFG